MDTIKIRELKGVPATGGFFYAEGQKLRPGETVEVEDAGIFDSEIIEVIPAKRGRKAKEDENATTE